MSNEPKTSSTTPTATEQRQQASRLLLRLQWLLVLLLIIALVWLFVSQQRFQNKVNERFQNSEQLVARLNEMDDRLFAINQPALSENNASSTNASVGKQAQNQLDLLRIQIQATDSLLADNNYKAAIDLLRGLQWQLSQSNNEIAPALTVVIKQSLSDDIERLQAQSAQPSPWQLQNLAIQNIQEFLHSYEFNNSLHGLSSNNKQSSNLEPLTRRELVTHEVIMTLNLAIQASNMRESDQLATYLKQARRQLQTLTSKNADTQKPATKTNEAKTEPLNRLEHDGLIDSNDTIKAPSNIAEVIIWLDNLLANAPKSTSLLTAQVLEQPKI